MFQVTCPHALYGPLCRVNENSYRVLGIVADMSNTTLQISAASGYASNYFKGGKLQCGDSMRMIIGHSGSLVTIVDGGSDIMVGSSVYLWPGCDRSMATCNSKFGNVANYGGLPFLPKKNPFSGDALV